MGRLLGCYALTYLWSSFFLRGTFNNLGTFYTALSLKKFYRIGPRFENCYKDCAKERKEGREGKNENRLPIHKATQEFIDFYVTLNAQNWLEEFFSYVLVVYFDQVLGAAHT